MKAVVIMRDRASYARQCCDMLAAAGLDVHIIDHASSYPPALEWLKHGPYPVHYRGDNYPPQSVWEWDRFHHIVGRFDPYIVTDCDVLPPHYDESPSWVAHLQACLHDSPGRVKIGLGLRIDDLPNTPLAQQVIMWERQHWHNQAPGGGRMLYGAAVDTTLAIYQPLVTHPRFALGPSARTAAPHLARHLPWYETGEPSEEQSYYVAHMNPDYSHWVNPARYA